MTDETNIGNMGLGTDSQGQFGWRSPPSFVREYMNEVSGRRNNEFGRFEGMIVRSNRTLERLSGQRVLSVNPEFDGSVRWASGVVDYREHPNEPRMIFERHYDFQGWVNTQVDRIIRTGVITSSNMPSGDVRVEMQFSPRNINLAQFPNPLVVQIIRTADRIFHSRLRQAELEELIRQELIDIAREELRDSIRTGYEAWDPDALAWSNTLGEILRNSTRPNRTTFVPTRQTLMDEMLTTGVDEIARAEDERFYRQLLNTTVGDYAATLRSPTGRPIQTGTTSNPNVTTAFDPGREEYRIRTDMMYPFQIKDLFEVGGKMYGYVGPDGKNYATKDPAKAGMKVNPKIEPPKQLDLFDDM